MLPNPGMDFTPFDTLPAASLDDMVENIEALADGTAIDALSHATTAISNPYKFRVYRNTSAQTAATGFVKAQFNAESYDTNNNFDSTTNYRYTAPTSGFYYFDSTVRLTTSQNDDYTVALYKNGSLISNGGFVHASTGSTQVSLIVSDTLELNASDYIEVFIYTTNAGGQNMNNGIGVSYFSGIRMSKT